MHQAQLIERLGVVYRFILDNESHQPIPHKQRSLGRSQLTKRIRLGDAAALSCKTKTPFRVGTLTLGAPGVSMRTVDTPLRTIPTTVRLKPIMGVEGSASNAMNRPWLTARVLLVQAVATELFATGLIMHSSLAAGTAHTCIPVSPRR
jgi:hypothetical protein